MTQVSLYDVTPVDLNPNDDVLFWKLQITARSDSNGKGMTQAPYAGDTLEEVEDMLIEALRLVKVRRKERGSTETC